MGSLWSFVWFVVGFALAWVIIRFVMKKSWNAYTKDKPEVRRERAIKYLERHGEITNDIYQRNTGVSDAQATRDLEVLEKEGRIVQIGKTGHAVKYRLK